MNRIIISFLFLFTVFTGCSVSLQNYEESDASAVISLACWNTQTFFDAEIEGTEYADFQNLAKWSKDKYLQRLSRLSEVIKTLNADVIVLEEIENVAVVQDIANQLAGNSWDKSKNWSYAAFGKDSGAAIGCAVFSKYEIKDLKFHSLKINTQKSVQPSVRPILELAVEAEGKPLQIFVNHWKSKSGGEESSEIWRDWQEALLAERVSCFLSQNGEAAACVMCGDFNRDAREFVCRFGGKQTDFNTIFRGCPGGGGESGESGEGESKLIRVYSPWFTSSGSLATETGSYFYNKNWERIDHIFILGNIRISAFSPRVDGDWAGVNGIPNIYRQFSGEGYSDHLPLMCTLTLL